MVYRVFRLGWSNQIPMEGYAGLRAFVTITDEPATNQHIKNTTKRLEGSLVAGRSTSGAMQMASTLSTHKIVAATRINLAMAA
jgi:hypothetical protein